MKIEDLLSEVADYPEMYNKISVSLYKNFGISSAPVVLLVMHYVIAYTGINSADYERKE